MPIVPFSITSTFLLSLHTPLCLLSLSLLPLHFFCPYIHLFAYCPFLYYLYISFVLTYTSLPIVPFSITSTFLLYLHTPLCLLSLSLSPLHFFCTYIHLFAYCPLSLHTPLYHLYISFVLTYTSLPIVPIVPFSITSTFLLYLHTPLCLLSLSLSPLHFFCTYIHLFAYCPFLYYLYISFVHLLHTPFVLTYTSLPIVPFSITSTFLLSFVLTYTSLPIVPSSITSTFLLYLHTPLCLLSLSLSPLHFFCPYIHLFAYCPFLYYLYISFVFCTYIHLCLCLLCLLSLSLLPLHFFCTYIHLFAYCPFLYHLYISFVLTYTSLPIVPFSITSTFLLYLHTPLCLLSLSLLPLHFFCTYIHLFAYCPFLYYLYTSTFLLYLHTPLCLLSLPLSPLHFFCTYIHLFAYCPFLYHLYISFVLTYTSLPIVPFSITSTFLLYLHTPLCLLSLSLLPLHFFCTYIHLFAYCPIVPFSITSTFLLYLHTPLCLLSLSLLPLHFFVPYIHTPLCLLSLSLSPLHFFCTYIHLFAYCPFLYYLYISFVLTYTSLPIVPFSITSTFLSPVFLLSLHTPLCLLSLSLLPLHFFCTYIHLFAYCPFLYHLYISFVLTYTSLPIVPFSITSTFCYAEKTKISSLEPQTRSTPSNLNQNLRQKRGRWAQGLASFYFE